MVIAAQILIDLINAIEVTRPMHNIPNQINELNFVNNSVTDILPLDEVNYNYFNSSNPSVNHTPSFPNNTPTDNYNFLAIVDLNSNSPKDPGIARDLSENPNTRPINSQKLTEGSTINRRIVDLLPNNNSEIDPYKDSSPRVDIRDINVYKKRVGYNYDYERKYMPNFYALLDKYVER